ncbi:MAG: carotenoid biosynthesis protein [Pseudanabaenaceae cyanobacterium bins.68]|nr:carotenoid biosynthesis protein [Pseudanabaenaceae cyanobacterium bins.68]
MNGLVQWSALALHIAAMFFGLAGLLLVLPNPEFVSSLSSLGVQIFGWGMSAGGAVYMILAAIATVIYGVRSLGWSKLLCFMVPAVGLSLGSELLGTSTGFPFGDYGYLTGLGYKVAGLVPFTIPLSWFYMGFACWLVAMSAIKPGKNWFLRLEAIATAAMMLTAWDFVLDPAMSQSAYPFWYYPDAELNSLGLFFGTPIQNFGGWMLTGVVFMLTATMIWGDRPLPRLSVQQLLFPVILYLANFIFGLVLSLSAQIYAPIFLGILFGVAPLLGLWRLADQADQLTADLEQVTLKTLVR